jgi:hypothetical protein
MSASAPIGQLMPAPTSVLKPIKKYLQQAMRLDKVEPLVAYYGNERHRQTNACKSPRGASLRLCSHVWSSSPLCCAVLCHAARLYAITQGVGIKAAKSKEDKLLLSNLMGYLETQKASKAVAKDEAKLRCEAFALQVFTHADNEDRKAGPATTPAEWKQTALAFHSAYIFMDVCKQFGALDKDVRNHHTTHRCHHDGTVPPAARAGL